MDEAFMRAINPSVPLRDLEAAVWMVMIGVAAAHLFVMPKFFASAPRYAAVLLGISIAGLVLAYFWIAHRPATFLWATFTYCVAFSALFILAGRKASTAARRAAVLASFALLLMVPLVYMLAFSAR
ncbi:MAG: hypothetical protein ACREPE_05165 [Lysobacter sp.]